MQVRIQKYLSEQGILSRRKAETYLKAGWIKVNGKVVTEMGLKIDPKIDKIELDDAIVWRKQRYKYIAFYKPKGIVTNCPLKGETEITDILPRNMRKLHSVGRLDKDSEGLILLTDDGIFAKNLLQHEAPHVREYLVWVNEKVNRDMLSEIEDGMMIQGEKTKPCTIKLLDDTYFKISLTEGKNRQIRRMVQKIGRFVVRLKRIRYGVILLGDLEKGMFRPLTEKEVQSLLAPCQPKHY